jgi:hypothetical protein
VRKADDLPPPSAECHENPEALSFRIPKGLFRPVAGKLYLLMVVILWLHLERVLRVLMKSLRIKRGTR